MSVTDDIVEIMMLKAAYVQAFDERRFDNLMELFTDDAVVDISAYGLYHEGKENIRSAFEKRMQLPPSEMHVATSPLIAVDGDTATGRWYLLWSGHTDRSFLEKYGAVYGSGFYDDKFRRVDGRWRIQEIVVGFTYFWDTAAEQRAQ